MCYKLSQYLDSSTQKQTTTVFRKRRQLARSSVQPDAAVDTVSTVTAQLAQSPATAIVQLDDLRVLLRKEVRSEMEKLQGPGIEPVSTSQAAFLVTPPIFTPPATEPHARTPKSTGH